MKILGLVFAGTSTDARAAMTTFCSEKLGLRRAGVAGAEADMFELLDGSHFAVADPRGMGDTSRSIGFLVADLDGAIATLAAAGVETGEVGGERDRALFPLPRAGREAVRARRTAPNHSLVVVQRHTSVTVAATVDTVDRPRREAQCAERVTDS